MVLNRIAKFNGFKHVYFTQVDLQEIQIRFYHKYCGWSHIFQFSRFSAMSICKYGVIGAPSAMDAIRHALETGIVWIAYKLYSTELFPTVIRTIALTTFSSTSLLGFIISPQLVYLKRYWHPTPFFVAAISAVLSAILSGLILPETKFVALPDTIDEAIKREELPCEEDEDNQKFIDAKEKINYS
uniref:Uncharacterized protein n=1 Tax=Acrobeloides nanus TaxID=290746 RepID=A0A914EFU3_9BILA